MSTYGEQLLSETIADSFSPADGRRLREALEADPPMREDVLRLLTQFKADLGPFFLRALSERVDCRRCSDDPLAEALRSALALPAAELCDELLGYGGAAA